MTFDEIEKEWNGAKREADKRALWRKWSRSGWFAACRDAVQRRDRATLEAWLNGSDATKQAIIRFKGEESARMVRAHLLCALTALERQHWPSGTVPTSALVSIAQEIQLPVGFLQGLTQELLGGKPRGAQREVSMTALLVDTARNTGVVTILFLELLPDGSGAIYPVTEQAFLPDDKFLGAADIARQFARQTWWCDNRDVRWRLTLRRDNRLIRTPLTGNSAGLAFALLLTKLFGDRELELDSVAATGVLEASGALPEKVGGLWDKLGTETMNLAHRRLLHTVVVSEHQDDVPSAYLRADAEPLWVFKAKDVPDAVRQINEQSLPRRAVRQYERKQCARLDILGKEVSLEEHYQALPLLREVKRERLPHVAMGRRGDDEDEQGGLRGVDIQRWEEALREEQVTYERHEVEEVFTQFRQVVKDAKSDVPRFVVIGPPGSGKTTLEQFLAWVRSQPRSERSERSGVVCSQPRSERSERSGVVRSQPRSERSERSGVVRSQPRSHSGVASVGTALRSAPCLTTNLVPARVRLREWEAWAVKSVDPEASLPEYLAERYKDLSNAPTADHWRRWLRRGEVLLLLDGLDEIAGNKSFIEALKNALTIFKDCPTVLTCRTVSFEQHKAICPDFPVFTLAGLEDAQRDAYIRAFPADHPDRFNPDALIAQLNRTPQMRPLAANPLLLSIICFVVDDPNGVTLPARRSELYDKAVEKLLDPPASLRRVEVAYPDNNPMPVTDKRRLLERAALTLFAGMDDQRQLTFDEDSLLDALTAAARAEGYGSAPRPYAVALLRDLTENRGLLRGGPTAGYFFLHLTLQEFLAACALAERVNKNGWDAIAAFVDKKAWDPRWQEVLILLAGKLNDPAPLLQLLTDEQKDDLFRHRLALAALCLPEVSGQLIDSITTFAFSLWWQNAMNLTAAAVPHLTRALPALAQVNGRITHAIRNTQYAGGTSLLDCLAALLRDPKSSVRWAAAWAVRGMGSAAATPEILTRIARLLEDPDRFVRSKAAEAVRGMGSAAATPEFLTRIARLLEDPDRDVRYAAAWAVEGMGSAAATPEILTRIARLLEDPDGFVRYAAARAVKGMGSAAATPEFLTRIARLLKDPDGGMRSAAAWAVGAMMRQGVRILRGRQGKWEGRRVEALSQ